MEISNEIGELHENVSSQEVVGFRIAKRRKRTMKKRRKFHHNHDKRVHDQGMIPSTTWHMAHVTAFLITSLLGLLGLKEQSPFKTNPTNMRAFFITICIYCIALAAKTLVSSTNPIYSRIFGHLSLIFGALSSISLAVIFVPQWLICSILVLGAILLIFVARHLLQKVQLWFYRKITNAVAQILNKFGRFMGRRLTEQQHLLV